MWPRLLLVCALGAVAFVPAACGGDSGGGDPAAGGGQPAKEAEPAKKAEPVHVKFAQVPIAGMAPVWIAQERGFFEEEGVIVENEAVTNPPVGIANVAGGKTEFAFAAAGSILTAVSENVPLKVVSPRYFSHKEQGIYVKADSPIKTVADLKGKRIAFGSLNSNSHAGVMVQLEQAGVKATDVKAILIPVPDLPATLRSGRVDAAQIIEPQISAEGDKIRPLLPDMFVPFGDGAIVSQVVTSEKWAKENPEVLAAFQRGLAKGQQLAASDESAVRAAVAKNTETPPALLEKMTLPAYGTDMAKESTQKTAEIMVEKGFIKKMPDLATLFIDPPK
jgi:NitT/TauT family transport system substrate-binding protein